MSDKDADLEWLRRESRTAHHAEALAKRLSYRAQMAQCAAICDRLIARIEAAEKMRDGLNEMLTNGERSESVEGDWWVVDQNVYETGAESRDAYDAARGGK